MRSLKAFCAKSSEPRDCLLLSPPQIHPKFYQDERPVHLLKLPTSNICQVVAALKNVLDAPPTSKVLPKVRQGERVPIPHAADNPLSVILPYREGAVFSSYKKYSYLNKEGQRGSKCSVGETHTRVSSGECVIQTPVKMKM